MDYRVYQFILVPRPALPGLTTPTLQPFFIIVVGPDIATHSRPLVTSGRYRCAAFRANECSSRTSSICMMQPWLRRDVCHAPSAMRAM